METEWYFRLFFVNLSWFLLSWALFSIIKAKRMTSPGPGKPWMIISTINMVVGWALTWFITYSINLAFWLGLAIIVFGLAVFALGYVAMREHPEKKQAVVDWGIYGVSRHSHVMAGLICLLGVVVMGWNPSSVLYIILWVYYAAQFVLSHFGVLSEEKLNIDRLGPEYGEYMKRVPRYLLV